MPNPMPITQIVASIRQELQHMKTLVHETKQENEVLKAELACRPRLQPEIDLESLRRGVVFRCHPDRGGDSSLLRKVLELFDCLAITASAPHVIEAAKRSHHQ